MAPNKRKSKGNKNDIDDNLPLDGTTIDDTIADYLVINVKG